MALSHGAMCWSAVFDCGISLSYSLAFYKDVFLYGCFFKHLIICFFLIFFLCSLQHLYDYLPVSLTVCVFFLIVDRQYLIISK